MNLDISYISHYVPIPSINADAICVMETCYGFAKNGHSVKLIVRGDFPEVSEILEEQEIWDFYGMDKKFSLIRLPGSFFYKFGFVGRAIYKTISLFQGLQKKGGLLYVRHLELAILAAIIGKKVVLEHHQISDIKNKWPIKVLSWYSRKGKVLFVSITKAGKKKLIKHGVPTDQISVAPMGIRLENFLISIKKSKHREEIDLPLDKTMIVYSGNLIEGRGIEELFTAMGDFPEILLLVLGGDPGDLVRCEKFVQRNQLKNILFIGPVPPKEVPNYLMAADILAMPYSSRTPIIRDISPMKMFDYMAAKKPIISSDFPVIREILHDKKNALLVEPDSATAISEGIHWILANPEKANLIGEQARKDVEKYTWDKRTEGVGDWLRDKIKDI